MSLTLSVFVGRLVLSIFWNRKRLLKHYLPQKNWVPFNLRLKLRDVFLLKWTDDFEVISNISNKCWNELLIYDARSIFVTRPLNLRLDSQRSALPSELFVVTARNERSLNHHGLNETHGMAWRRGIYDELVFYWKGPLQAVGKKAHLDVLRQSWSAWGCFTRKFYARMRCFWKSEH